jgi:orotate phosphoribosyltransferase
VAKDHGEGGVLVGADVKGKRVLLVDDVITAGTAIREAMQLMEKEGATVVGVVVALDRQEKGAAEGQTKSAIQEVQEQFGIQVAAVATLAQLQEYIAANQSEYAPALLEAIKAYRAAYGVC